MLSFQVFNLFLRKKRMFQVQDYFEQELRFKEYVIVFLLTLLVFLAFSALVTKKVEKIRTMSREERHTENLFLGFYNVV